MCQHWKTCRLFPEIQLGLFPLLSDDRCAFLNTEGSCVLHCREWKMPFILWYGRSGNTGWENSVKKKRRHNASSLKNVFWCERGKCEALPVCSPAVGYNICTALYTCSWVDLTICQRNIQVIFQPKIAFHKEAYFWTEKRFNIVTLLHLPQCTLCFCMYCVVLKVIHANCN